MAAPSRAGWGDYTPEMRYCQWCKEKLTLKLKGGLFFSTMGHRLVWHSECRRRWEKAQ